MSNTWGSVTSAGRFSLLLFPGTYDSLPPLGNLPQMLGLSLILAFGILLFFYHLDLRAGIFKQYMGARHRVGIGLSYRPARLHRLAEFIPWNRFMGSINV
jgi:hypothetical protein